MFSAKYVSQMQSYFVLALIEEEVWVGVFFLFCYVLLILHFVMEMSASLHIA